MPSRRNKTFYPVSKGKSDESIGIYTSWHSCEKEVQFVSGAVYTGTTTLSQAVQELKLKGIEKPLVHHEGQSYSLECFLERFPSFASKFDYIDCIDNDLICCTPRRSDHVAQLLSTLVEEDLCEHADSDHEEVNVPMDHHSDIRWEESVCEHADSDHEEEVNGSMDPHNAASGVSESTHVKEVIRALQPSAPQMEDSPYHVSENTEVKELFGTLQPSAPPIEVEIDTDDEIIQEALDAFKTPKYCSPRLRRRLSGNSSGGTCKSCKSRSRSMNRPPNILSSMSIMEKFLVQLDAKYDAGLSLLQVMKGEIG